MSTSIFGQKTTKKDDVKYFFAAYKQDFLVCSSPWFWV